MDRLMTARYAGTCTACRQPIPVGAQIRYNGKARHAACAAPVAAPVDYVLEDLLGTEDHILGALEQPSYNRNPRTGETRREVDARLRQELTRVRAQIQARRLAVAS